MITVTIPPIVAAVALANLLILLIGSILFVRWVVKTVGILRAAEFGTLFDKSARQAGAELDRAAAVTLRGMNEQRELILAMNPQLKKVTECMTPGAVNAAIEERAQEVASARIDSERGQRFKAESRANRLEALVYGMTGSATDLADVVKDGLTGYWDPTLRGRVEAYCAQRGIRVGRAKRSAAGFDREPIS